MSLVEQSRLDVQCIVENLEEWGQNMTFTSPDGTMIAAIQGIHTKHHMSVDDYGVPFNDRKASVAVSDASFPDTYPLYNADGDVRLKGHKVTVTDSKQQYTYIIKEWFPDRAIGLIVCILGDFE